MAETAKRRARSGVVLKLHHAAAIHRWLELLMDDRKFDNPIVAGETHRSAHEAKAELGRKLIRQFGGGTHGGD